MSTTVAPSLGNIDQESKRELTLINPDVDSSKFGDEESESVERNKRNFFGLFQMETQIVITNATTSIANTTIPLNLGASGIVGYLTGTYTAANAGSKYAATLLALSCLPSGLVVCS